MNSINSTPVKLISIVGARPQFIKAAPVSRAIDQHNLDNHGPQITEILVHTGQHYDYKMSQVFFDQLEILPPRYNLGVGSGNHGQMTGAMLAKIETVLLKERPDWVLVHGDTNSTVAGAMAAVKLHIPVAHVEAGLRSFNRRMPEEINRVLTDHISSILFCPTDTAVKNLIKEGFTNIVNDGKFFNRDLFENRPSAFSFQLSPLVVNVGDVMYDAFLANKNLAHQKSGILSDLELKPKSYCLATVHRQENTEDPRRLLNIFTAFEELSSADCPFIILLHPRTRKALQLHKGKVRLSPHIRLLSPASYLDMIALEVHARVILTDSGGVQKEGYFARVPCVTLRDETEWIETIEAGWNHLGGADCRQIADAFEKAINSFPLEQPGLYGDGNASHLLLRNLISCHRKGRPKVIKPVCSRPV
ncbi:MAG: UDP-N-acetyl glucosamine 2-epimerase [Desulfobacterales bacterium]|nr:UDP-N-acetyl glucosamine 2-epimerase [Desulfobacterales bacterium]